MSSKVVIIGGCAGAKVAYDIFTRKGFQVCFFKNFTKEWGGIYPEILKDVDLQGVIKRSCDGWFVAAGDNAERRAITQRYAKRIGRAPNNAFHPSSVAPVDFTVGDGNLVCAQAVIGIGARIGDGVIINTAATVDHDCRIGDFAQIGPGAHLAGYVEVGERTNIGTGACVIPHIKIGKDATVAAGACVIHDVEDGDTVMGVPAHSKRHGYEQGDENERSPLAKIHARRALERKENDPHRP